jgi:hypothetical protein
VKQRCQARGCHVVTEMNHAVGGTIVHCTSPALISSLPRARRGVAANTRHSDTNESNLLIIVPCAIQGSLMRGRGLVPAYEESDYEGYCKGV